ncbi:non-specific lipid transfer protein GPI-anchored 2-like [Chenopodium quinoa]|uniref:non-specific lipid transfer protein GPI-anchored 2-like n=1 Tax=Chenopodium quinoa TaxID=63459 RepID=UPI000B798119|nr:non-specific lipid transfer protein GPI-anchored 2-like [Chenopodium quinoa]
MSDCLTYVEKGSKSAKPDKNCCPELAGMLDTNPIFFCQMLGKSKDFPIDLDLKKALKLPYVCGLQTPDVSLCSVATPLTSFRRKPEATKWKTTPFRHYDVLLKLFSKDRATGEIF